MGWEQQRDWNRLEVSTQNEDAKSFLKMACNVLGLQENVELVDVKDNDRFVLHYEQSLSHPDFGRNMIRVETLMRQLMGVVVDLRLEAKEDRNKRKERTGRA